LGERQLDKLEVTGSSPVAPIPRFWLLAPGTCLAANHGRRRGMYIGIGTLIVIIILIILLT
jgi:hypothetical protein